MPAAAPLAFKSSAPQRVTDGPVLLDLCYSRPPPAGHPRVTGDSNTSLPTQVQPVSRKKLQLVGITALLLASKYEEMFSPNIEDFVYITDNAYTSAQILEMEMLILKELKFELGRPLPLHFLRRASKAGEVSTRTPVESLLAPREALI